MAEPSSFRASRPCFVPPAGSCDCHLHLFGPENAYPLAPGRAYTPFPAPLEDARAMLAALGLERVVLVQPSVYGTDNRCLLDGLRTLDERARGVVVVGEETGAEEFRRLHALGVRGVRLNVVAAGAPSVSRLAGRIRDLARRIEPFGWHLQLYLPSRLLAVLAPVLTRLEVPVVVDHMAGLPVTAGRNHEARGSLLRLLTSGRVWVKLSAPYRVPGADEDPAALRALVRTLIEARPDRLLWGSDWPHTPPHPCSAKGPAPRQRFRPLDTGRLLERLADWAPDHAFRRLILVENPERLYDFA